MKYYIRKYLNNCLVVSCLAIFMAFTSPASGSTLASGNFNCTVSTVEPPNGTGIPNATVSISFYDTLGMAGGPVSNYVTIGTGSGLNEACQSLANTFSQLVANLGCTRSTIQNTQSVGGNFTEDRWNFGVLCRGDQRKVVSAVGVMLEGLLTIPNVTQQALSVKSNEIRNSDLNIPVQNK